MSETLTDTLPQPVLLHGDEIIRESFDNPSTIIPAVPTWDNSASKGQRGRLWRGDWASQSELNQFEIRTDGQGANGSVGYLALIGTDSDEFYIESTPYWWENITECDLRDTYTTFYLKALEPITVAEGYLPYLFISNHEIDAEYAKTYGSGQCGWIVSEPLTVGQDDWAFNEVNLANDESLWTRYHGGRSLDTVLGNCGYIGVMYLKGTNYMGVQANGVLGWDEFAYGPGLKKG
jgi:hypothetical protein